MTVLEKLRWLILPVVLLSTAAFSATVNINNATATQLAENLTGVGESRAAAIVAYRNAKGPFRRVEDLAAVEGIGPHIVELNRTVIVLGGKPQSKKP